LEKNEQVGFLHHSTPAHDREAARRPRAGGRNTLTVAARL
jgi:hypothetical protein